MNLWWCLVTIKTFAFFKIYRNNTIIEKQDIVTSYPDHLWYIPIRSHLLILLLLMLPESAAWIKTVDSPRTAENTKFLRICPRGQNNIFTTRTRRMGKVMFSHVSVRMGYPPVRSLSGGRGYSLVTSLTRGLSPPPLSGKEECLGYALSPWLMKYRERNVTAVTDPGFPRQWGWTTYYLANFPSKTAWRWIFFGVGRIL